VDIKFIASVGVIAADPRKSRELYVDALGLPLEASEGDDYFHSERIDGSKHFGVWPLSQAAQACFESLNGPPTARSRRFRSSPRSPTPTPYNLGPMS
jgi:catechol 2,3-dioxygenase-like lactoylglutathione lyase family enzyme